MNTVLYPGEFGHYISADKALLIIKALSVMYSNNVMGNCDKLVCFLWVTSKGYNTEPLTLHEIGTWKQTPQEFIDIKGNFSVWVAKKWSESKGKKEEEEKEILPKTKHAKGKESIGEQVDPELNSTFRSATPSAKDSAGTETLRSADDTARAQQASLA